MEESSEKEAEKVIWGQNWEGLDRQVREQDRTYRWVILIFCGPWGPSVTWTGCAYNMLHTAFQGARIHENQGLQVKRKKSPAVGHGEGVKILGQKAVMCFGRCYIRKMNRAVVCGHPEWRDRQAWWETTAIIQSCSDWVRSWGPRQRNRKEGQTQETSQAPLDSRKRRKKRSNKFWP